MGSEDNKRGDGVSVLLGKRFREALNYGAELHESQTRKGGSIPYVGHLLIVAGTVIEWGGDEDQAVAAILHDAIEDQSDKEPRLAIRRRFGARVEGMVEGLSDTDVIPKPAWPNRKKQYFARLENECNDVLLISAADKLHNARAILSDLIELGEAVWTRFSISDQGATPQLWYLTNLLKIYEQRLPDQATRELRSVVEELERRAKVFLVDLQDPS